MLSEAKSASGGKQNTIILMVILMLVVGAGSFGVGYKVAQAKTAISGFTRNGAPRTGNQSGQNNMMRNRQTIGEIISLDDKSMTVKMTDGSSRIVLLSSTMTVTQLADAKVADLKIGSKVAVFGTNNTDGSQTATSVELNPRMPNITPAVQK